MSTSLERPARIRRLAQPRLCHESSSRRTSARAFAVRGSSPMPATFAHPVFALPFKRFKLPLPALVCGSMAPDLAYLIPGHIPHAFRHNPVGIFVFALPVGLALTALYHRIFEKR